MNLDITIQLYRASGPYSRERDFQAATARFFAELEAEGLMAWFHPSPNAYRGALSRAGRGKAARAGAQAKLAGVKKGVPDFIVHSHQLAIELKVKGGYPTKEQKEWMETARYWGWVCEVCREPAEVVAVLERMEVLE